jgi:hypothetical protein
MSVNLYRLKFFRKYSFAPDFTLCFEAEYAHPKVWVVDANNIWFSKPEVVKMNCTSPSRAWTLARPILSAMKRYFFLAQTQKYLADFKIKSDMIGDDLSIDVPICSTSELKCNNVGWRLIFVPMASIIPSSPDPVTILTGQYTTRCALVIAHLVFWYHMWRSSYLHLFHILPPSATFAAITGDRSLSTFLLIDGFFMSVSLNNAFKVVDCTPHVHRCVIPWSFNPQFHITAPAAGFLHHFMPASPRSDQFLAFMQLVVMPLLHIPNECKILKAHWSACPFSTHCPPISFCLVYKKRYSLSVVVQLMMCLTIVPTVGLSAFLPFGLRDLHLINALRPGKAHTCYIYQVRLRCLQNVMESVEAVGDLVDVLLEAGFIPDISTLSFRRKIGNYVFKIDLSDTKIIYNIQGYEPLTEELNLLADGATPLSEFVAAVTRLVTVFLTQDHGVLTEVLKLLVQVKPDFELAVLCQAMQSVVIGDDGRPSMHFNCGKGFNVTFPVPYRATAQLEISSGSHSEKVRGIEGFLTGFREKTGIFRGYL